MDGTLACTSDPETWPAIGEKRHMTFGMPARSEHVTMVLRGPARPRQRVRFRSSERVSTNLIQAGDRAVICG